MAEPTATDSSAWMQAIAAAGLFVGGAIATFIGARTKPTPAVTDETAELRAQLASLNLRREMEGELERILSAARIANDTRFTEFENRINEKIDGLTEERRQEIRDMDKRVRDLEFGRGPRSV